MAAIRGCAIMAAVNQVCFWPPTSHIIQKDWTTSLTKAATRMTCSICNEYCKQGQSEWFEALSLNKYTHTIVRYVMLICVDIWPSNIKQILHANVLDIKVYYYSRNVIFHEAAGRVQYYHSKGIVINLISNTVKVQYYVYYTHYACVQNRVKALMTEMQMHSSKTTQSYQKKKNRCHHDSLNLASTCILKTTRLFAREGLATSDLPHACERTVSHKGLVIAPSLSSNDLESIF